MNHMYVKGLSGDLSMNVCSMDAMEMVSKHGAIFPTHGYSSILQIVIIIEHRIIMCHYK